MNNFSWGLLKEFIYAFVLWKPTNVIWAHVGWNMVLNLFNGSYRNYISSNSILKLLQLFVATDVHEPLFTIWSSSYGLLFIISDLWCALGYENWYFLLHWCILDNGRRLYGQTIAFHSLNTKLVVSDVSSQNFSILYSSLSLSIPSLTLGV